MTRRFTAVLVSMVLTLFAPVAPAAAQERSRLLDQAGRATRDADRRLDLLMSAADPGLEDPDSLWVRAVVELAQTLVTQENDVLASVWMRWVLRHGPAWTYPSGYYPAATDEVYRRSRAEVQMDPDTVAARIRTEWQWPRAFDSAAPGSIAVSGEAEVPELHLVVPLGPTSASGREVSLQPGTYDVVATAPGYDSVRVTREVLPGVTTTLLVELTPVAPESLVPRVRGGLVQIRSGAACSNGVLWEGGKVLTSFQGLPAGELEVVTAGGRGSARSRVRNAGSDLGVFETDATGGSPVPAAPTVSGGDRAWAVFHPGCQEPMSAQTRLGSRWPADPEGPVVLGEPLPPEARGAPLVDRDGNLLGIVISSNRVIPVKLAERLIAEAGGGS